MRYCGYWQLEAMRCNDVWSVYEIQISNHMSQHFITVMCCAAGVIRLCYFVTLCAWYGKKFSSKCNFRIKLIGLKLMKNSNQICLWLGGSLSEALQGDIF